MARQTWTNRLTYILTVAGATIGFGATWRFPYLVGENGGGAYVLVFIVAMLLVGVPIILVENVIGRRAMCNCVDAFAVPVAGRKSHPLWKLCGYGALLGAFGILAYYMVIGGWVVSYIVNIAIGLFSDAGLDLSSSVSKEVTEAFYNDNIVNAPLDITLYTLVFVWLNWIILKRGVIAGIERSVRYLMPLLFICLIVMVIRNLTLDGAAQGVEFYLLPDFSKITPELFLMVLGQVFFALSLGFGVMITLSSHLSAKEDLIRTATITGIINTLIAVMCGFMIFPSLFTAGLSPDSGPSLVFKTLPIAFSQIHFGGFFALIFFLLLIVAAFTTSLTIYQVIIAVLNEKFGIRLNGAINLTLGFVFIFGNLPCILSSSVLSDVTFINRSIFDAFDYISGNICFVLTALGSTLFAGFVLKEEAVIELSNRGTFKSALHKVWYNYTRYIVPLIIIGIFLYSIL